MQGTGSTVMMEKSASDDGHQAEMPNRSSSIPYLLRTILSSRKFKVLAAGSWLGYWLLYSVSGGMFFYSSFDVSPLLKTSLVPNPYFISDFSSFSGFYNSGMVWYPDGHLQINLVYGPLIFSLILATLFSMNIILTLFSVGFARFTKGTGTIGILALLPALFSGGCCSVPLGLALVGIFAPTAGLTALVYGYPYLINLAFVILMVLSLFYIGRRVAKVCDLRSGERQNA
ncbi:MAG: hypothetical protein JRN33_02220 [Nitrososphaerota archaeon]|nr:hypothetical protein [Nitrososphaerota archaeon]